MVGPVIPLVNDESYFDHIKEEGTKTPYGVP